MPDSSLAAKSGDTHDVENLNDEPSFDTGLKEVEPLKSREESAKDIARNDDSVPPAQKKNSRVGPLAVYAAMVIFFLILHGVLQERIMGVPYEGEYFPYSLFLVCVNRLVSVAWAALQICHSRESFVPAAPCWKYFASSMSVAASFFQYEALKFVPFPLQMVVKSFKVIPVMFWSILLTRTTYPWHQWLYAVVVTIGISVFAYGGNNMSEDHQESSIWGIFLLLCYLATDGFTSSFQEYLFKAHPSSKNNQMMYSSLASATICLLYLLVSGDVWLALDFCNYHPDVLLHIGLLSVVATGSQWFILAVVKGYGAVTLALTLNVRQILSIATSYAIYGHGITMVQILALVVALGAILDRNLRQFMRHPGGPKKSAVPPSTVGKPSFDTITPTDLEEKNLVFGCRSDES